MFSNVVVCDSDNFVQQIGFAMLKLLNHAESMLGGMVAVLVVLYFAAVGGAMFLASGISHVFDMQNGTFYPVVLLFSIFGGMMGSISAIINWYIFR